MTISPTATLAALGSTSLGHLALWCGLVLLTLALVLLVATRWGKSHPVATCGVLSLLAHILLACVATIVRLVGATDHVAEGPPIRVRIVDAEVAAEMNSPPPLLPKQELQAVVEDETQAAEIVPAVEALLPPDKPIAEDSGVPSESVEPSGKPGDVDESAATSDPPPPELLAEAAPAADPSESIEPSEELSPTEETEVPAVSTEELEQVVPVADEVASASTTEPPALAEPVTVDVSIPAQSTWATSHPVPPAYVSTAPPVSTPYDHRLQQDRLGFVKREGGSRETEAAVRAALAWLAAAQSPDGRWDASRFGAGQERAVLGHNRNGAGARADTGVSGLALLAFMGAGHTHHSGEYADSIFRGLQFLVRQQASDGNLGGEATLYAHMYCHSMAAFALAEALAMTGDRRWAPAVERAVNYSVAAQHPASGGWRYRPGQTGDTSQLGWKLMALRSAELGGVYVPPATWTNVERFLRSVTRGASGGLACYRPETPTSRSMTAEALYCRQLMSSAVRGRVEPAAATEATAAILGETPGSGPVNLYYWYYATLALHHQKDTSADAERAWNEWNDALKRTLLALQTTHGADAGSWPADSMWGGYGGRVYTTAVAALCLEVYYRYSQPTDLGDWIATRPGDSRQNR